MFQYQCAGSSVERLIVMYCEELVTSIATELCREACIGAKCSVTFDMDHVALVVAQHTV